jgi:hypothetical protein
MNCHGQSDFIIDVNRNRTYTIGSLAVRCYLIDASCDIRTISGSPVNLKPVSIIQVKNLLYMYYLYEPKD